MITVRAGSGAIGVCLLLLVAGCSREQQDWRSAEAADSIEGYGQFIQRHPESELATQARTRVAQLGEDRDWQHAGSADTVDAYRDFIAQHPNGKWAQEARIRIENFSLGEQTGTDAGSRTAAGRTGRSGGSGSAGAGASAAAGTAAAGSAGRGASSGADDVPSAAAQLGPATTASSGARSYGLASPGEAATPSKPSADAGSGAATAAPVATAPHVGPTSPGPAQTGAGQASATQAGQRPARPTGFGIQLGAFSTEAGATTEWRLLTSRHASELQGLQEHVVPADTPAGRIYRLQAAVGDEGKARSICDLLRRRGQACVAVLPH
ncbi:MAG: hypothetical protein QOI59_1483 [Gammaproteobacteria bacterium]|nr:hypothetical protein [Gammaproteobacteria bacterium]